MARFLAAGSLPALYSAHLAQAWLLTQAKALGEMPITSLPLRAWIRRILPHESPV